MLTDIFTPSIIVVSNCLAHIYYLHVNVTSKKKELCPNSLRNTKGTLRMYMYGVYGICRGPTALGANAFFDVA